MVVGTGYAVFGAEVTSGATVIVPAGDSPRKRRRYLVEWKGEEREFDSLTEAQAFIALAQAEVAQVTQAVQKLRKRPKDAVRWDLEPDVPAIPARPVLRRVRVPVYVAPPKSVVDAMMRRVMDDEEEELLLMLMESL